MNAGGLSFLGIEMVPKGMTEGHEIGLKPISLWPKKADRPSISSYETVRHTEDRGPDVITLYEEGGIWASKKKTPSFQRSPFWYTRSGRAYAIIHSKGETIDLFA